MADDGAAFDGGIERLVTELRAVLATADASASRSTDHARKPQKKQSSFEKAKALVGGSQKQPVIVDVSDATADTIYGGILYRNDSGTTAANDPLTPRDFLINDD